MIYVLLCIITVNDYLHLLFLFADVKALSVCDMKTDTVLKIHIKCVSLSNKHYYLYTP